GGVAEGGKRVARVESGLVGGECPYFACMPSKAMLLAAELRHSIRRHAVEAGAIARPLVLDSDRDAYAAAVARRDEVADHRDDSDAARRLEAKGVRLVRARGRIEEAGVLTAGEWRLGWHELVIATGARPREPSIRGLAGVPFWTSEQFFSSAELPESAVVIGGGAVGFEIAQVLNRFGCHATLVQHSPRLLPREEPAISDALAGALREDGIDVRLSVEVDRVDALTGGARVALRDGSALSVGRVLVAIGKRANTDDIGLERLGIAPHATGTAAWRVDPTCGRAATSPVPPRTPTRRTTPPGRSRRISWAARPAPIIARSRAGSTRSPRSRRWASPRPRRACRATTSPSP